MADAADNLLLIEESKSSVVQSSVYGLGQTTSRLESLDCPDVRGIVARKIRKKTLTPKGPKSGKAAQNE